MHQDMEGIRIVAAIPHPDEGWHDDGAAVGVTPLYAVRRFDSSATSDTFHPSFQINIQKTKKTVGLCY